MKKSQSLRITAFIAIIYSVVMMFWILTDYFQSMEVPLSRIVSTMFILVLSLVALEFADKWK